VKITVIYQCFDGDRVQIYKYKCFRVENFVNIVNRKTLV